MGNYESIKRCENCNIVAGSTAILKIFHHGELGGRYLCTDCFNDYKEDCNYISKDIRKNRKTKIGKCIYCNYKNKSKLSYHLFKIYWYGKYDKMIMCEKCLYDKSRRRG